MSKQILIVLSEWGCWDGELVGPLETFGDEVLEKGLRHQGYNTEVK